MRGGWGKAGCCCRRKGSEPLSPFQQEQPKLRLCRVWLGGPGRFDLHLGLISPLPWATLCFVLLSFWWPLVLEMMRCAGVAWYSCSLSPAAPFLPASSLSNEMHTVKKLGLCCFSLAFFFPGVMRERREKRQRVVKADWWATHDTAGRMGNFWWGTFSPASPMLPGGAGATNAIPLGAGLGTEDGKHLLVFQSWVQNRGRSLRHLNILIWGFAGESHLSKTYEV